MFLAEILFLSMMWNCENLDSNGGDIYQYEVGMDDLSWELCDSTTSIVLFK